MGSTVGAKAVRCADDNEDEEVDAKSLVSRRHRCNCGVISIMMTKQEEFLKRWKIIEECKSKINGNNSLINHCK